MWELVFIVNEYEIAVQLHATRDDALVASMNIIPAVELELKIRERTVDTESKV